MLENIDIAQGLDLLAKTLGVLTAIVAIVTALTQVALPTVLKRRERWLGEVIGREENKNRKALLASLRDRTTARLIGGILVPGWRFIEPLWLMGIGAVQYYYWSRDTSDVWNLLVASFIAFLAVATPLRRIIRLSCERTRVVHEYLVGKKVFNPVRLSLLSQLEGGTRTEYWHSLLASLAANLVVVGVALLFLELPVAGLIVGSIGLVGAVAMWFQIRGYVKDRVGTYGPWSTDDPKFF